MQFDLKKARIDLFAIAAFAIVSLLFCFPQLKGKQLVGSDNKHWMGMAHEGMAYHEATGKDVLWSNSMFGGMPTYTTYVAAANHNYPSYIQTILQSVGKPAYFFFIAMLSFYLLMRVMKVEKWLGAIGAFAFAFATYNPIIISVGHDTKMLSMAYLPAAIAGLYLIFNEKWLTGAAVFGISIALIISNNHFQMLYYFLIVFVFMGIGMFAEALKNGKLGKFFISAAIAAVTAVVGIGPGMTSILTTNEYTKETMRGGASELSDHDKKTNGGLDKEYAFRWSNGVGETFCIMIPYLYGGSTSEPADRAPKTNELTGGRQETLPTYWGPQPGVSGPVYFGAIICFLFVLGMLIIKSVHKWWILAASIFAIILSCGKNLEGINYFLFDHMPMLNKFRTVSMALIIPQFLFPFLGIWAVQDIVSGKVDKTELWKYLKIAAGVTAGLCVVLGIGGSAFFDFKGAIDAQLPKEIVPSLISDRSSMAMKSGLTSAVLILAAAGLIWALINDKIKSNIFLGGLALLVVVDLLPVAHNYLNEDKFKDASDPEASFTPRKVDEAILQDKDPYYRVFDISSDPFNDATQAYFHKCVGGYSPAKMEVYQDLISHHLSKGFNSQVLNMLNTKYLIFGRPGQEQIAPNRTACGNAWFVSEVKWTKNADEDINALNAPAFMDTNIVPNAFEPKKTAVMRETFKTEMGAFAFSKDSAAYVKLDKYGLDDISYKSSNSKDGLAVFSDIYYDKGWKAYIDGKETPIMKADYVLRAIKIPAGQHNITFEFKPKSFEQGQQVALASSIALVLLCAAAVVSGLKNQQSA